MEMVVGIFRFFGGIVRRVVFVFFKGKEVGLEFFKCLVLKGFEEFILKYEVISEGVFFFLSDLGGLDGLVILFEGFSGKSKKRSLFFFFRRNKKEKKFKGAGRFSEKFSLSFLEEVVIKFKFLWKLVFFGYKKDKKKKGEDKFCFSIFFSRIIVDSGKYRMFFFMRVGTLVSRVFRGTEYEVCFFYLFDFF